MGALRRSSRIYVQNDLHGHARFTRDPLTSTFVTLAVTLLAMHAGIGSDDVRYAIAGGARSLMIALPIIVVVLLMQKRIMYGLTLW